MFNIFLHLIFVCFQIVSCVLSALWGHCLAQMLLRGDSLIGYGVSFAVFSFTFSSDLAFDSLPMLLSADLPHLFYLEWVVLLGSVTYCLLQS